MSVLWYNSVMLTVPDDLGELSASDLYAWKDKVRAYRSWYACGYKTPEALQVRSWAKDEIGRLNRELRRRKLPLRAPDDDRLYGPKGL